MRDRRPVTFNAHIIGTGRQSYRASAPASQANKHGSCGEMIFRHTHTVKINQSFPFHGTLIWLTSEQGGRTTGPPATPAEMDYAATAYVPPMTGRTGLASFVVRVDDRTAWHTAAAGRWLHTEPTKHPAAVEPGTVLVIIEGVRDVAYFHLERVDQTMSVTMS